MKLKLLNFNLGQTSLFTRSALIFIFFFSLFLFIHLLNGQFTSSDDPYYHAKHAWLIEQTGRLTLVEPWLEFHFFNYAPVDPWWGYHLLMALFIHWFGLFLGVEIFASLLAALVFLVFYLVLSQLNLRYPLVWTACLFFTSTVFGFRLFLERPHLLSMAVMPLVNFLLIKNKNFWLFILSLVYIILYDSALIILVPILMYLLVDFFMNQRFNFKPLVAMAGGLLVGIMIHPASLNYLYVAWLQLWQVLFLKFTGINLNIGAEAQTMDFSFFLNNNFLALLFYLVAMALFLATRKNGGQNLLTKSFLALSASSWFLVALLVPRGVEYWLPANFLFIAAIFGEPARIMEFREAKHFLSRRVNLKVLGFFMVSVLVLIIFNNLSNIFFSSYKTGTSELGRNYEQANLWLKDHTVKNSVVFYSNWGMWPMMFFYNNYNHYIHGIDPTFFYEYDKQTYWLWQNLSYLGLYCDQPTPCLDLSPRQQIKLVPLAIKNVFRSRYAILPNETASGLVKTLNNLKLEAQLVFKNRELLIYEIK